jgi:transposase InsO family protein
MRLAAPVPSFAAARRASAAWIRWYNEARPH